MWQLPQPFCWKTASPGGPALAPFFMKAANLAGVTTSAWLRISAWPRPQSSVQITGNVPRCVGVMTSELCWPGTASCFCENSGTQNEWMTSLAVMSSFTCRPFGSVR